MKPGTEAFNSGVKMWLRGEIDSIDKRLQIGRLRVRFEWRSTRNIWGRFGGGWNWALGLLAGDSTLIVHLLVCSLIFSWEKGNDNG